MFNLFLFIIISNKIKYLILKKIKINFFKNLKSDNIRIRVFF
jgi:hypothetical protein